MTFVVPEGLHGARLVDVCWAHLGAVARRAVGPTIGSGGVTVDGVIGSIAGPVQSGQQLVLLPSAQARLEAEGRVTPPSALPLVVVHEDEQLLIVDKPAGVHVHPMGRYRHDTLLGRVLWHAGARPASPWTTCRPSPAHRLDRPTSGLVVFARSIAVRDVLQGMFEQHQVIRTYEAEVQGVPDDPSGTIEVPLGRDPADPRRRGEVPVADGGQQARTRWRVMSTDGHTTRLQLHLDTGRTHQIRAHLANLGHPIVGDELYGAARIGPPVDPVVGATIALRAVRIVAPHPSGSGVLDVTA